MDICELDAHKKALEALEGFVMGNIEYLSGVIELLKSLFSDITWG
jgi:hypothetical protein